MRLGISYALSYENAEKWVDLHQKCGCRTVAFPLDCTADEKTIEAYAKAARDADLTIAEVGVWRNMLSSDPKVREEVFEYTVGQIRMADSIGARCVVNVAGAPYGDRWDGGYRQNFTEETRKLTVATIQKIIDTAKPKKTKFSIEPMPWMIPTGPEEYLRLIDAVDRPEFGVHLDIVNMINCPERYFFSDEFLEHTFELLHGRILSCHMKDTLLLPDYTFQLRECAPGQGTLNLELYAKLATREDPDMPMIIEHLKTAEDYYESLAYVQKRLGIQ